MTFCTQCPLAVYFKDIWSPLQRVWVQMRPHKHGASSRPKLLTLRWYVCKTFVENRLFSLLLQNYSIHQIYLVYKELSTSRQYMYIKPFIPETQLVQKVAVSQKTTSKLRFNNLTHW